MRLYALILAAWLLSPAGALAQDVPADEAIIRELLAVTESEKMLDGVYAQMDAMMVQAMQDALGGKAVTAEQQALLDEMRERMVAIMRESVGWEVLEPMTIDIYRKSFTQQEAQGMLDFYRSDAGRAVIAKMPLVMQHTMTAMQEQLKIMFPRIQEVQKDIIARLKALPQPPP